MQKVSKKVCSLLLALVMLVGMMPLSAMAAENGTTQWIGTDLQLGEDLTMRFYANISGEHAADGVMTVTVDGQTYETFTVSEMTAGDNGYVFPVALGAAQMTAQVKLTLVSGGQTVLEKTSSIRNYANAILEGNYTQELKNLVKWLLNYGAAAQGYFGVNTEKLANAGYEMESNQVIAEEVPAVAVSDGIVGINFYGVSMLFRSKIALRFYFTISDDATYTFTCNGQTCEAVEKDGKFYVDAPDINPQSMEDKIQVVVSDGSKNLTVSYSPMDYITRMYRKDSSSDGLKTMLTYAADYFDAAESYVNGTEENLVVSDTFAVGAYGAGENFTIDLSDYNGALKGYTLSGAAVNGTAFTSASYADGVVALDRAAIQALSGEQTLNLTFSNGQKTMNVPVNVELYTMAIGTAEDMQAFPAVMKANPSGHYVLTNDIDMKNVAYSNDATVPFAGTFDGRGYTIYNMNTKASSVDMHGGFFGMYFGADGSGVEVEGAVLKNISFVNATVWGRGSFLAMRGQGAVENVYFRVNIQDLFADVNDPNPWYNSTSVLFNVAYWDVELKNVIVEYNEALTDNNGWGYALGQIYGSNQESNFYVIGADNYYGQGVEPNYATLEAGCYADRAAFKAAQNDLSGFEATEFWVIVNNFPVPKNLVGTEYEKATSVSFTVSGTMDLEAYSTVENISVALNAEERAIVAGTTKLSASVDGVAFSNVSYVDGVIALDRATLKNVATGAKTILVVFETEDYNITAKINANLYTMMIGTAEELQSFPAVMKEEPTGHYILTNDIDMKNVAYSSDATVPFAGTFDGQGYSIFNMNTKASHVDMHGGFFGMYFGANDTGVEVEGAVLKNISFVNATVWGRGSFLAMKGQGAVENVYLRVNIQDLFADVNDPNPWYNSTSVLFNVAYWDVELKNVIVEYNEALTDNNGWGYALGQIYGSNCESNFFVVGADNYYGQGVEPNYATLEAACYADRAAMRAAAPDVSAFENDFWTVVDGYPIPQRLVGTKYENAGKPHETVTLEGSQYVGTANSGETFTINLSALKDRIAPFALADVTINGTSFATKSYADGVLTLDRASVANMTDTEAIVITFENDDEKLTVCANLDFCTMTISTAEDMQAFPAVMKANPTGHYVLTNDIDMNGVAYSNDATVPFAGTFDGQGYSIFNMYSKTSSVDMHGGFFGMYFGANDTGVEVEGAVLKNISFVNATVWGRGSFLAMRGQGAVENVYFRVNIQDLFAHVEDPNPWYNSTSVLFNVAYWDVELKNVIVEYNEALVDNNGWGYALGQIYGSNSESNFYVIGADNYYGQGVEPNYATLEAGCYADRVAFKQAALGLTAFDSSFWTIVDGFPVPNNLVGTDYAKSPVYNATADLKNPVYAEKGATVAEYDFGAQQSVVAYTALKSATLNGEAITAAYSSGKLTLTGDALATLTGDAQLVLVFENESKVLSVNVTVVPCDMIINDADELKAMPAAMNANPSGVFVLGNDIQFSGTYDCNTYATHFAGTFDGQGYVIYDFATKLWESAFIGFVGDTLTPEGVIKNVSFVNVYNEKMGPIIAHNMQGTMENVYIRVNQNPYNHAGEYNNLFGTYTMATAKINNVVVEHTVSAVGAANPVYVLGNAAGTYNGLYVIGADNVVANNIQITGTFEAFADRAAFDADVSAWDGNGFWTVVDGFPVPTRLVGTIYEQAPMPEETVELTADCYVGSGDAFVIDFSEIPVANRTGATLNDAKVDARSFASISCNYTAAKVTLDAATLGEMNIGDSKTVTLIFVSNTKVLYVKATVTKRDVVEISTAAELQNFPTLMAENPSGYYVLTNDIDMDGVSYSNSFEGNFTGTFDGQGYTIYNLCTKTSADDTLHGFFGMNFGAEGTPQHSATLKNISFVDAVVWGRGSFLAMNGSGTLENVYMNCTVKDLFADVNDPNPWYNSTSVLFNKGKWYLTADKVIVEYAEPLTDNNGWGYAVGFPDNVGEFDNFYVVGADQYYGQIGPYSEQATNTACYADRTAFGATGTDFSAWYATGFWAEDPATKTPVPASQVVFNDYNDGYAAGTVHDVSVHAATRKFVSGGSSDYTVVAAGDAQSQLAATYLIGIVKNATGVTLSTGTYSGSGKYIVINDADAFAAAGLSMPETDLGTAGYYIVTSNDNVFIMTGKETGAQNAVLAFLKHVVGMEVYGVDTVVFTKTGETMPDMVIIEKPDIPNHMMGNWRGYYETAGELSGRYLLGYTHFSHQFLQKDGADNHTSMLYLPYSTYGKSVLLGGQGHSKWYSKRGLFQTPSQLCYNAQGDADELAAMVDEAATQILNELNKAENAAITMGQFSIMDNEDCCNCDACKADLAKYGSNNGAVVEFMNLLSAEIQERLQAQADEAGTAKREFTLYLMAYNAYEDAPSMNLSEIHFHENLGVIYAPIDASYTHSFYESQNADVATNMRNWATLSDHLYYWLYETNFRHYMIPHDSWTTSVENLRFAYECDADIVMIQGQHNQAYATGFTALKVYLNSVAGQNVNAMNDGGYQRAVNSFFANYYGKGGNEMQQLYEELQAWMNGLSGQYTGQINSGNCDALANAAYWPKDMLVSWLSLVEKAERDAAGDAKALKHIRAEGIFIRYMLIEFYGDTYSDSELAAMKSSFKEDCAALGIVKATEFDNVADLWN